MSRSFRPLTDKDRQKARERIARADAQIKEELAKIKPASQDKAEREDEYTWGTIWAKSDVTSRYRERVELGSVL